VRSETPLRHREVFDDVHQWPGTLDIQATSSHLVPQFGSDLLVWPSSRHREPMDRPTMVQRSSKVFETQVHVRNAGHSLTVTVCTSMIRTHGEREGQPELIRFGSGLAWRRHRRADGPDDSAAARTKREPWRPNAFSSDSRFRQTPRADPGWQSG